MIQIPNPAGVSVSIWLVNLDKPSIKIGSELTDSLSASELARANRFVRPQHTQRYIASHHALRALLSAHTKIHPKELQFSEGPHGKPHLTCKNPPPFNMSHSDDWALIGIGSDSPIGVDIELNHPITDLNSLAARNLSTAELQALASLPEGEQLHAFLRCWTRKEACLKAVGNGLSIEPGTFSAGLERESRPVTLGPADTPLQLNVVSLNLPMDAAAAMAWIAPT